MKQIELSHFVYHTLTASGSKESELSGKARPALILIQLKSFFVEGGIVPESNVDKFSVSSFADSTATLLSHTQTFGCSLRNALTAENEAIRPAGRATLTGSKR